MTHTSFTISRKCLKSLEEKLSLQLHDYFKIFFISLSNRHLSEGHKKVLKYTQLTRN